MSIIEDEIVNWINNNPTKSFDVEIIDDNKEDDKNTDVPYTLCITSNRKYIFYQFIITIIRSYPNRRTGCTVKYSENSAVIDKLIPMMDKFPKKRLTIQVILNFFDDGIKKWGIENPSNKLKDIVEVINNVDIDSIADNYDNVIHNIEPSQNVEEVSSNTKSPPQELDSDCFITDENIGNKCSEEICINNDNMTEEYTECYNNSHTKCNSDIAINNFLATNSEYDIGKLYYQKIRINNQIKEYVLNQTNIIDIRNNHKNKYNSVLMDLKDNFIVVKINKLNDNTHLNEFVMYSKFFWNNIKLNNFIE